MPTPWFFIRCPVCGEFWAEDGDHRAGETFATACLLCTRLVTIVFGLATDGTLAVSSVTEVDTGRRGEWSRLLDTKVHWRDVN